MSILGIRDLFSYPPQILENIFVPPQNHKNIFIPPQILENILVPPQIYPKNFRTPQKILSQPGADKKWKTPYSTSKVMILLVVRSWPSLYFEDDHCTQPLLRGILSNVFLKKECNLTYLRSSTLSF